MGSEKRISAYTLGCKTNQYDTNAMLELLAADGFEIVPWGERSDIYLINTCTVTNTADKKSRNMIRRVVRQNADAVVCVCGCLAQKMAQSLLEMVGVYAVIGTDDRKKIVKIVRECLRNGTVDAVQDISKKRAYEEISVKTSGELTRGYVKIQEGCNSFCSYCIIPYVRGRSRSRRVEDIIKEANILAKNGVKEIVLTGTHISSYGQDSGEALIALLQGLNAIPGIFRIRLGSLEPHILTESFLREAVQIKKVCAHFHVSLQSGSTPVLKRMKRGYTAREYANAIGLVRKYYDLPGITTDVITGFPQESETEFLETRLLIEEIGFSRIHVFPYSERKGTSAEKMSGSVPVAERKRRAQELITVGKRMERAYAGQFLHTIQEVLFEECDEEGYMVGYTDRYLRIVARGGKLENCARVLLERVTGDIIEGKILPME